MSAVPAHSPIAALLRPRGHVRPADVAPDDREHAVTVVAHLLHAECEQWSWTTHRSERHRPDALRIVGALTREGWAPRSAA
jgi:hypothetical protein